ncbi:MAG: efflux RND transporter permease subunit [Deltaproteobacteria bacterium]|nr:efflux RND transporter permease subunit [Candidatus Zymogenaceae bacterium]
MSISRFSVKNPIFANLITILVYVFGIMYAAQLSREVFPSIDFGYIMITTPYAGASPEDIENLITTPIEDAVADVDGIDEITSRSSEGISIVLIKAELIVEGTALDQMLNDVKNEVDKVKNDLPDDADDPECRKLEPEFAVITAGVFGNVSEEDLRETADRLKNKFELIDGVSTVTMDGYRDREFWVEVDPRKLEATNLTLTKIITAIKQSNLNVPGGTLKEKEKDLLIRAIGEVETADDIAKIVVISRSGGVIRVGDIARVSETYEDEDVINRLDGKRSITLGVSKKTGGDVIEIADEVKSIVEEEKAYTPAGVSISTLMDESKYVDKRQKTLLNNALLGMMLVLLLLYLFLDTRVALWAAQGIPFCFLILFIFMYYDGMTLNLLSMFAMLLVLGIVVDDAIIVGENIYRYYERGMPLKEAAILGADEVVKPVLAAVFTNIASFIPLIFMSGIMGKFMVTIPIVVVVVFAASLLESFVLLPSHLVEFGGSKKQKKENNTEKLGRFWHWFDQVRESYGRLLEKLIKRRYLVLSGLVGFMIFTLIFGMLTMKVVFREKSIAEKFGVTINMPVDSSLEETEKVADRVEALVRARPTDEIEAVITKIGGTSSRFVSISSSYIGEIQVELTEHGYKNIGAETIINELRKQTDGIPGALSITYEEEAKGPPTGSAVSMKISGEDFGVLTKLAGDIENKLKSMKGVTDVDDDYDTGKEEVRFYFDEFKMGTLGLSVSSIAAELRNAFSGGDAGSIRRGDEKLSIIVKYREGLDTIDHLKNLSMPNAGGDRISVKSVADIVFDEGLLMIRHEDRNRTVTVSANVIGGQATSGSVNKELIKDFGTRSAEYAGYSFTYGGEFRDTQESVASLEKLLLIAVLIVYLIMALLFQSYLQPLIVMTAVPFSFIGVVYGLFIMDLNLSITALIGVVALVGLVVNDSIVLVDFINRSRDQGMGMYEAVVESGKIRLRPIILTTVTTIGGLISMALGIGGKEPMLTPMASVVVWGLLFSTTLTLLVVPCIYMIVEDIREKFSREKS